MYKGFKLNFEGENIQNFIKNYLEKGNSFFEKIQNNITTKNFRSYLNDKKGIVNVDEIIKDWFPSLTDYHIFISHSHYDEKLAISLAGYLKEKYGLKSFVDSKLWGYSNLLLEKIDEELSKTEDKQYYSYKKRNESTSHIHNILAMSLLRMIDETECFILLDTQESIPLKDVINDKKFTFSSWIYSENIMSEFIRTRIPSRLRQNNFGEVVEASKKVEFSYELETKHLIEISLKDIVNYNNFNEPSDVLDYLYKIASNKIEKNKKKNKVINILKEKSGNRWLLGK